MKNSNKIKLLIRSDDIGSSHSANLACIDSCLHGISRSVELMVPCPWFEEACQLLTQHSQIDVGIHLTITSEWDSIKWGPLTHAPSLEEQSGQFFPMLYNNENYSKSRALKYQNWDLKELESEFRAQIELGLKKVPHVSHVSHHMAIDFTDFDQRIGLLSKRLSKEYGLDIHLEQEGFQYVDLYKRGVDKFHKREKNLIDSLKSLQPGNYYFIDHPALDNEEMREIKHKGYENVAEDRYDCLRVFTSKKVLSIIKELDIRLMSYRDIK